MVVLGDGGLIRSFIEEGRYAWYPFGCAARGCGRYRCRDLDKHRLGGRAGCAIEDSNAISVAVGTGVFVDGLVGFKASGATNEEASAQVIAQCQSAGGRECTSDEVTNDYLCIVSVGDDSNEIVAGGAGVAVEAACDDAVQRAAANGIPLGPTAAIVISDCH